jgi:hypothetical protein
MRVRKKPLLKKKDIIISKYVWLWGEEQLILMHIVENENRWEIF